MKIIMSFFIIAIFLLTMWYLNPGSCASWIRKNETDLAYHGVVISKFMDIKEKNQPRVILDNGGKYRPQNMEIYNKTKIGDIMYKEAGILKRYLVQGSDSITFYSRCGGVDVK